MNRTAKNQRAVIFEILVSRYLEINSFDQHFKTKKLII